MVKVLLLGPLTIVARPPRSPLFKTVAPFFQTKVNGPGPDAVVLKVAVPPSQSAWSAGSVVLFPSTSTVAKTSDSLSAMTWILAVPAAVAVNVADAWPSTKLALTPDRLPSAGVPLEKIAPPELPALFVAKELVVTVSGPPLSTMIAPPLRFGALLLEKLEVLMV